VHLAFEKDFNTYDFTLVGNRLNLDMGHVFRDKIQARLRGFYQNSDYRFFQGRTDSGRIEERDDDTYWIGASLGYLISDRMDLTLTVGRHERDSNLTGFSFDNEFVILTFNFNYDFRSRGSFTEEYLYY
jgi:hypothetical protein